MSSSYSPPAGSGSVTFPITVGQGGTGQTTNRLAGAGVGIQMLSALGGGSAETTDMTNSTPAFEGQFAASYYNNKYPFLWFGKSTTTGDWRAPFNFPTGVGQIGSTAEMSTTAVDSQNLKLHFFGSSTAYNTAGDAGPIVFNWSTNSSTTTAYSIAIQGGAANSGIATTLDNVGCQFAHSPARSIPGLMPGCAMLVFNYRNPDMRGFGIASPGHTGWQAGADTGNFSGLFVDFQNGVSGFPFWVTSAYQPNDAGWAWTAKFAHSTQQSIFYGEIQSQQNNGKITLNSPGIAIHGYTSNNGTMAFCDSGYTADFFLCSSLQGIQLPNAGQGLSIKAGTNARLGTATLNGTTAVVISNTSVTNNTRIFLTTNTAAGTQGTPFVSAVVAGTSFSIKSTNAADTSTVAYFLVESQ